MMSGDYDDGNNEFISFDSLRAENLKEFEKLHLGVLPIRYDKEFYRKLLNGPEDWVIVVYWRNTKLIGAISCLYENLNHKLCITTLVVEAIHRSKGIGTLLVEKIIERCEQKNINQIYLHVHIQNSDAIHFYQRLGFRATGRIDNYYTRIDDPHCFILTKQLSNS